MPPAEGTAVTVIRLRQRRNGNGTDHAPRGKLPLDPLGVVLFDESTEAFAQFCAEITAALAPRDPLEAVLAERVAVCAWRLRRIYRIEAGLFDKARTSWHDGRPKRTRDIELVFLRLTGRDNSLAKLSGYEAAIERALYHAIGMLRQMQRTRFRTDPSS